MRIRATIGLSLMLLLLSCGAANACTGFAVYGENGSIYGMNFDNRDRDYVLRYDHHEGYRGVYSVFCQWDEADTYLNTPMMNEDGFFTAIQWHSPEQPYSMEWREGEESVANLAIWTPFVYDRVEDIRELVKTTPLNHIYVSCHSLYADSTGDAMVLELIDGEVILTEIENRYIVMTNFPNAWIEDVPMEELMSIPYGGADRYQIADAYIKDRVDTFTAEDGLKTLELAVNNNFFSPTAYSLVFDPANRSIYLTMQADFEHVWRIDMDKQAVETYRGFDEAVSFDIGEDGIALKALLAEQW